MSFIVILICAALIGIDQITKIVAVQQLAPIGSIEIIRGVFSLTYVENIGAAFGILEGARWFFVVLTPCVLVGLIVYYLRLPQGKVYQWVRCALVLIFSGAVGNFIDRLRQGYVIDFFHATFIEFPVFNMADIYLVCGTILLVVLTTFFIKDEPNETETKEEIAKA